MDYKEKYYKYKTKYLHLRNNLNLTEYGKKNNIENKIDSTQTEFDHALQNMYFIHESNDINTIIKILKSGILKPGKDVKKCERKFSGGEAQEYIYSNIYFDDIKNIDRTMVPSILLHPNIIKDFDVIMNKGWRCKPMKNSIIINKKDTLYDKLNKLKKMYKFIETLDGLHNYEKNGPGHLQHEILLSKQIDIHKYALGITCEPQHVKMLKKVISKYDYDIKIIPLLPNELLVKNPRELF